MPPTAVRSRGFCFTWNNYPPDYDLSTLQARYYIAGKEIAPTTGTRHLQGYVYWDQPKTLRSVRQKLSSCHVVVARGSAAANRLYCSKEGDYVEAGDMPGDADSRGSNEITRWDSAWTNAKNGHFDEIPGDLRVRYYSTFKRIHQDYMPAVEPLPGVCGTWIYGLSGCGKTRSCLAAFPNAYFKPRNKWWDGYQYEDTVVVDDFDVFDRALGGLLKHWGDYCPFIGEVKGGGIRIRPKRVIVTSQYRVEEIWDDEPTREAINRRFTFIHKEEGQNIILTLYFHIDYPSKTVKLGVRRASCPQKSFLAA